MSEWYAPLSHWLEATPEWLGLAIFLAACLECLAVAGILIPGTVLLFALGVMAGSGALSLGEIAQILRKPYRPLPPALIQGVLRVLKPLRLSQYGPEQVDFLRSRPVLATRRLKEEFGYTPRYTSREAFIAFHDAQGVPHA